MQKKIIFMGSPDFAIPSLNALIHSQHHLQCVYSQPPKPAGRGYKLTNTPIHNLALKHNLLIKTPINFKDNNAIEEFANFHPDLAIVVAYGLIIPESLLSIPKYGFINLHPSALPKFRGASPLQHTILSGDNNTDICIIQMDKGIDTGNILIKKNIILDQNINFHQLHNITANIGAELIIQAVDNIENIQSIPQSLDGASYASKINKEECKIDFNKDNITIIDRKIRALNPFPGTFMIWQNKILKIKSAKIKLEDHNFEIGTVIFDSNIKIACIGGYLLPEILQLEGKKEMNMLEFLNGHK